MDKELLKNALEEIKLSETCKQNIVQACQKEYPRHKKDIKTIALKFAACVFLMMMSVWLYQNNQAAEKSSIMADHQTISYQQEAISDGSRKSENDLTQCSDLIIPVALPQDFWPDDLSCNHYVANAADDYLIFSNQDETRRIQIDFLESDALPDDSAVFDEDALVLEYQGYLLVIHTKGITLTEKINMIVSLYRTEE